MESGLQDLAKLGSVNVPSGELCKQLGLSYRQLTEWDRRGALPHIRSSERGWREFSLWQVMGLKIASECRERFGIPLSRLRKPLLWMTGEEEGPLEGFRRDAATMTLWGGLDQGSSQEERFLELFQVFMESGDDGVAFGQALEGKLVPALCQRGWSENDARPFVQEFIEINYRPGLGCQAIGNALNLLNQSIEAHDDPAIIASLLLVQHLVPMFSGYKSMAAGFPTYLASDLEDHHFLLDSVELSQCLQSGRFPTAPTVRIEQLVIFRVNEAVNSVLEATGFTPLEVVFDEAAQGMPVDLAPNEAEEAILALVKKKDFERIVIRPKGGGSYQVTLRRELGTAKEDEIAEILRNHDYQYIGVNRQDAQNVRVRQDVSLLVGPDGVTGKIPERTRVGP